jgi:hypothetical protein
LSKPHEGTMSFKQLKVNDTINEDLKYRTVYTQTQHIHNIEHCNQMNLNEITNVKPSTFNPSHPSLTSILYSFWRKSLKKSLGIRKHLEPSVAVPVDERKICTFGDSYIW